MTGTSAAPCLVADVGGTNVRFALLHDGKTAENAANLVCADYPDLAAAVRVYFTEAAPSARPTRAAIAVASPITGDHVELTNNGWAFSIADGHDRTGDRARRVGAYPIGPRLDRLGDGRRARDPGCP